MRFIRGLFFISIFFGCFLSFSQTKVIIDKDYRGEALAKDYFDRGEFEKALLSYQKLYDKSRNNPIYLLKIVEVHQQLEQYSIAETILLEQVLKNRDPQFLVELGYNYQLKGNQEKAEENYKLSILRVEENPAYTFYVARRFEEHALIDFAAEAYERAMGVRPDANFNIQLARIYGEQGKIEKMFTSYINFVEKSTGYINQSKRIFSDFISENSEGENNKLLRRALLKKIQTQPDNIIWNQMLSWLFIQQRDYNKAFAQEKAIFRRNPETLRGILDLANITIEEDETDIANQVLNYIIENAVDINTVLRAHESILDIEVKNAKSEEDYGIINKKYETLLSEFGIRSQTLDLQISYGHFIAFYLNQPEEASNFLKETLKTRLSKFQQAKVKLKLGDILVLQEKFNEALIYYSQIQTSLKNSTISQQARFKVAQTSYYKGDFKWAESQLKILKSSTSQLIANDALDLKLLISDNKLEDSTQTALKLYAKADLLAFQNKTEKAIVLLDQVLDNHKTETIIDQTLYFQAQLFEKQKEFNKAKVNYEFIIENFREDILIDDAYYALAELYIREFNKPEKAKELYEQIIFNHADSIYFVEARKKYRTLRGDDLN
ncbi:hypothetical protein D7030_08600 [Flavobacteriaceae bacterium AU392]|nr:hypothetical protein D1817_14605 [Flavobacteriaceae bacterium]RKM84082.1 hypothetical protein D7030_08600 [Flavobacteriaceae bacterium AU392]